MYINSYHKKAQELLDQGELKKSLAAFNRALKINENHPDILSHRGVVYLHLNQKKNCLDDLLLSLKLDETNAYRYASLAYARDYFGDLEGAIKDYQKAVEIDPEDAVSHNNLGLLLEKQGYQSKAQKNFEKADKLSQIQKEMFDKLDEIEGKSAEEKSSEADSYIPKGEKLQPRKLTPDKQPTKKEVLKNVVTKKSVFIEFITFIKNGFKLKEDDTQGKS
ncbi:MAG: tetratricopeptide repeat protein [Brumimicrobium sp.]